MSRQAVVLAGGLATRMRPRTLTTPKFLLPVNGKPFAHLLLARLSACGYTEAVLCIAHLGQEIRDEIGDGSRFGIAVRYADEGNELRGTAGALQQALPALSPTFLVTYGDSYLPFDYASPLELLRGCSTASGVMAVYPNKGQWDASNTELRTGADGLLYVGRYEKGSSDASLDHIDYGAMALRRSWIEGLPDDYRGGLEILQAQRAREGRLLACVAPHRFYEIGSEQGLLDLEAYLRHPQEDVL